MYFQNASGMLINTIFTILITLLLIRFFSVLVFARNPLYQSIHLITEPFIKPFRNLIPRFYGFETTALVLAYLITFFKIYLTINLQGVSANIIGMLVLALADLLNNFITIVYWTLIARIIISWVAPNSPNPAIQLIVQLTNPLLMLGQRIIPSFGGIDFSPILIILVLRFFQMSFVMWLQSNALQLL